MLKIDRIILSTVLALTLVHAEASEVAVYAKEVHQEQGNLIANDGVVVEHDGSLFRAQSAKYNKAKNSILLQGDVTLIEKSGKRIRAKELTVNLDDNHVVFKDFFTMGRDHIWISSTDGEKKENKIKVENALFSSCDVNDPDWMLGFNKAIYDTESEVVKFYDAKVYVKKVPVFYFPYLYIPLSNERRSGFLYPDISIRGKDGFSYRQPYFWNISRSQDLTIDAQIMAKRGYGVSAEYRFYHAKDAFGAIRAGYYKDKKSYVEKENLLHSKHYGIEFNYLNGSLLDSLANNGYENKLYINGTYFNDGDYFNLSANPLSHHRVGSYYDSRLNYYIKKSDSFYVGITSDFYKSTVKEHNDDTIQILPQIQFHMPFTSLVGNSISYSLDATNANLTRNKGTKAGKSVIKAPLFAHFSLLNNYLNLDISEELQISAYRFINVPLKNKKYERVSLNHKVSLSSDLTKIYDSGIHTLMLSAVYTKSNKLSESWMKYDEIPADLKEDFVDDLAYRHEIALRAHQIWSSFGSKLSIDHILESSYNLDNKKFENIENTFYLKYENWSFYSFLDYSVDAKKLREIHNTIGYSNGKYGLSLGYLWNRDYQSFATLSKQLTFSSYYKYSNRLKFSASADYDFSYKKVSNWNVTTDFNRKCWAVRFSFGQDIRPVLKSSGQSSIKNNYFSFNFTILPFGISYGK